LSSSTGEYAALGAPPQLTGEGLAELLSVIAEAPDFGTAATFLVGQLADIVGASQACLLTLDRSNQGLMVAATVGFEVGQAPKLRIAIEDEMHPLVTSLLSLNTIYCEGAGPAPRVGLPFRAWTAVPFPQPQFRGAPPLLPERRMDMAVPGCAVVESPERRRRIGHAPCGLVVLDRVFPADVRTALSHAAMLAGPVLSRMFAVEEYRRSAERLDAQRDLLTAILNSLPDPIVITDAANDIVVHNRRAEHLLTIKESDSEGRRRAVEINNLLFTSFLSKSAMAAGEPQGGSRELNLVDPDEGTDLLFEVLAHPLSADISREGSFVSVLRDVTDLRRAANELERQIQRVRLAEFDATRERDRLDMILENVADPIIVTDDRSDIILMNRLAEELLQESESSPRSRLAVRGNDTRFTSFISDFTISPAAARREQMTLTHPATGVPFPVEVVSGKIVNQRGEPLAIVSVMHDLTKQVENERLYTELKSFSAQLEARIQAATADLAQQNKRLQWQSRELEKANRLKSEFLASMSHELRTPINALIGYTSLMLDRIYGELTTKQEEGLHRIQASAQHLLALINDILDLAKIEAGKMPLNLEEASLAQIISEISQQIEPLVRKKSLTYVTELPAQDLTLYTDRTKVKQIILNLLSNAVKFTHAGTITLRVVAERDGVRMDIIDTGIGIRAEDLQAIWEDFRQVDQSRTREFGGTGLGLSITRKLLEALGGSIGVESDYAVGSTFSVRLPMRSQYPPGEERVPRMAVDAGVVGPR
jgi:PAS domain S-box-containing protein